MKLAENLSRSRGLAIWVGKRLSGLPYPTEDKNKLACACFDMVFEHNRSILELINKRLNGTASSLLRLVFDSYVRGEWLYRCASDKEVEQYQVDRLNKKFWQLIEDIENTPGYEEKLLSKSKELNWRKLNSLTHSGIAQLSHRFNGEYQEPNYSEEELNVVINYAKALVFFSILSVAEISDDKKLVEDVMEKAEIELSST